MICSAICILASSASSSTKNISTTHGCSSKSCLSYYSPHSFTIAISGHGCTRSKKSYYTLLLNWSTKYFSVTKCYFGHWACRQSQATVYFDYYSNDAVQHSFIKEMQALKCFARCSSQICVVPILLFFIWRKWVSYIQPCSYFAVRWIGFNNSW